MKVGQARRGQFEPIEVPEKFVVQQKMNIFWLGLFLIFVCGGATVHSLATKGYEASADMLLAGGVCVFAGVVTLLKYKNHRLEVDGEELCYTATNGKKTRFHVSEIENLRRDVSGNPKVMGAEGRVLARVERNMENFAQIILYFKEHNIKAV